jgi:hypothetical protein
MPEGYIPSLEHGIANPRQAPRGTTRDPEDTGGGTKPWEITPAMATTSHIHSFQWHDTQDPTDSVGRFLRKFPGEIGQGRSELVVRFKEEKTGRVSRAYTYFYSNVAEGRAIVAELRVSPHPYGEVLYPKVIKAGVPYTGS